MERFLEGDRIIVRSLRYPVPTSEEVALLLESIPKSRPDLHLAFMILACCGCRPIEVARLKWKHIIFDKNEERVLKLRHLVYKARNRKTYTGTNYYYKLAEKPVCRLLSKEIIHYAKISPKYERDKVFPFDTQDALQKHLTKLRKKQKQDPQQDYAFILDQVIEVLKGEDNMTRYRVTLYALRRFVFTYYFWVIFGGDEIRLAKEFGHENPRTTLENYVFPKESIGLTQELIKQKLSISEFINTKQRFQTTLLDHDPEYSKKFTPAGQRSLFDF